MKKIALIAALAIAAPSWSQDAKPPAQAQKPAAAAEAPKGPEAPKADAPKAPRKVPVHPAKRQEDARHCLEKGSNAEIIKCAEAYL